MKVFNILEVVVEKFLCYIFFIKFIWNEKVEFDIRLLLLKLLYFFDNKFEEKEESKNIFFIDNIVEKIIINILEVDKEKEF